LINIAVRRAYRPRTKNDASLVCDDADHDVNGFGNYRTCISWLQSRYFTFYQCHHPHYWPS